MTYQEQDIIYSAACNDDVTTLHRTLIDSDDADILAISLR